jgi:hypothetical protein
VVAHIMTNSEKLKRNYAREKKNSQQQLFRDMLELRQDRFSPTAELVQIAQVMVFCGLPYRPTTARELTKASRAADGSEIRVTFRAMFDGVALPYGSDRTLLHWMVDKAIKDQSPFVGWDTAVRYLRDMKLSTGGRAFADLRKRYERIASMAISVRRTTYTDERFVMPVVRASRMPMSIAGTAVAEMEGPLGFQFDEVFFHEILQHHVPVVKKLLEITAERPQMQDYMIFLGWRSFAAQAETLIPWERLREQLWQEDSNPRRIRTRFRDAIAALKTGWPELRAEAQAKGLWIAPPRHGVQLIALNSETKTAPAQGREAPRLGTALVAHQVAALAKTKKLFT